MHVLVAMSGGVDSSVTAALLLKERHRVTGFTFMVADCEAEKVNSAVNDARRVADALDIPHITADVSQAFTSLVIEPFIEEYAHGRTPNPCTVCNRVLKFTTLIEKAEELGADMIATGHYARLEPGSDGLCHLTQGIDRSRDQSYFLFNLRQDQLQKSLFPLGARHKADIRNVADEMNLPVADKPDSQEICFIPDDDYTAFIRAQYPETLRLGEIVDMDGTVLGTHEGIQFYTIGQRKGIGAHAKRKYVVKIDAEHNRVIIGDNDDLMHTEFRIRSVNWIVPPPGKSFTASAKVRSTTPPLPCEITCSDDDVLITFHEPQRAITPGQAGVIYLGDEVLGGGYIV
jgi:tRNA-specific 2-thiouridylase